MSGQAAVLTWDWREQPDLDRLARILGELTAIPASLDLYQVKTGSDEYAIVLTTVPLEPQVVQDIYNRAMDDDAPDVIEISAEG